jgi:hypothetical protein
MKDEEWVGLGGLIGTQLLRRALTKGANLPTPPSPQINFIRADGTTHKTDTRVKITVPVGYTDAQEGDFEKGTRIFQGIIFPYTPSIQFEHKANYSAQNPTHSNFTQYFYQHSSVSPITISGKFTVEHDADAEMLLSTIHLLKSLTKMQQGTDPQKGAPPPVCRLFGYGNYMLENVPVVITSFKHELPENVDYFTAHKDGNIQNFSTNNSVPVVSSITVVCNPIYSRQQIKDFSVTSWLSGDFNKQGQNKGYL